MAHTKVVVVYAVPIPLGHRVTMRWYREDSEGFFGKKTKVREYAPVIIDHDTGVEYISDFAFNRGDGFKRPNEPFGITDEPTAGFVVDREIAGLVRKCRVVHLRNFSDVDVQTHFDIEES